VVVAKQNVSGLNPQAQVRYRGIRVGKVNDIRLDPDDSSNILISIEVNDDVPLTRGTVAKLNYRASPGWPTSSCSKPAGTRSRCRSTRLLRRGSR